MDMTKTNLLFSIFFAAALSASAAEWPTTVEEVCASNREQLQRLFEAVALDMPELTSARKAFEANNLPAACHALLRYYNDRFPTVAPVGNDVDVTGYGFNVDAILEDRFIFYSVADTVPRTAAGGLDWNWRGPTDDREWAWALNRHFYLSALLNAWRAAGDAVYVCKIDDLIKDWVVSNPYTAEKGASAAWRGLEVALRMKNWRSVFTSLQGCEQFSPAAKLLMLASLPDHVHYIRNFHAAGNNWLTMEMNGLAIIATTWPELRGSNLWLDYAFEQLIPSLEEQVHSDGAQTELTSHYHRVALFNFQEFADTVENAGRGVPDSFRRGLERMWNYLAYTMRPNGHGLLNNDSDYDYTRTHVRAAAARYHRPDWTHIASNGEAGAPPERPASIVFPCAGHVIFRQNYSSQGNWAYFNVGPLGTGHVHYDKLHLSVTMGGRDILVDSGRYTYVGGPWREYFIGSASHNVILVDGNGQKNYPARLERPLNGLIFDEHGAATVFPESLGDGVTASKTPDFVLCPEYGYARGTFEHGYRGLQGRAAHTRIVICNASRSGMIVLDYVETDRPREITALWQFHPDCSVVIEEAAVKTDDEGQPNLRLQPFGDANWEISLVKGQETPSIQGWYSPKYNTKRAAVTAVSAATISGNMLFGWLLSSTIESPPEPPSFTLDDDGWATLVPGTLFDTVDRLRVPVTAEGRPEMIE